MEFRTYKNRIVLIDDEEQALAEIDFPAMEEEPGTVEITHTYVDETLRGRGLAGKLMERLITYLQRNQLKAYPSCSYAVDWFAKHSEAADLLSPSYDALQSATFTVPDRVLRSTTPADATTPTPTTSADHVDSSTTPSSMARSFQDDTRSAKRPPIREEEDDEADAYFRDTEYGTDEEDGPVDGGIHDHILMGVNRILQLFSVAALLLSYILMIVPALENLDALGPIESMITDHNVAEICFISVFAGITIFTLISFFWILSRKKYVRYGQLESIDTGRGITTFIVLLLVELLASLLSPIMESVQPVIIGLAIASSRLVVNRAMILMAAGLGLVLSIIRKIIKH